MSVIQSQSTSGPSSISQAAALAALTGPQGFLNERAESFRARQDMVVGGLNAVPGLSCRTPEGAFYVLADCGGFAGSRASDGVSLADDRAFCRWLLDTAGVAVVPGSAFGLPGYFRLSYATGAAELREALKRIAQVCAGLHRCAPER